MTKHLIVKFLIIGGLIAPLITFGQYDHASLLKMEKQVQETVAKVLPATVSLMPDVKSGPTGSGSGVIVSKEGLILTAAHVVGEADEMLVIFPDGKRAKAEALGCNYTRDIALVRIIDKNEEGWPFVEMGDSDSVKVSDMVIAMGHAGGFDIHRSPPIRIGRSYNKGTEKFIMTDCTLIGGDSGGPLYSLDGKVLGINSFIGMSLSQNNHAPVSVAIKYWDRLVSGDRWGTGFGGPAADGNKPVLGIKIGEDSGELLIEEVISDSPAEAAGLQKGDKIIRLSDKEVKDRRTFFEVMGEYKAGDRVRVVVLRDGKEVETKVKLGRRKDFIGKAGPKKPESEAPELETEKPAKAKGFLGAVLVDDEQGNVVVENVLPDTAAAKAGLAAGDIVLEMDGEAPDDLSGLAGMLSGHGPGDEVTFKVKRNDEERELKVELGIRPNN
jgi:serine protease Do